MRRALAAAGEEAAELSIVLCADPEIQELNRDYAGEDRPTDVLSFSQREGPYGLDPALLGDIVISVETARRQAATRDEGEQETFDAELLHLAVHGLAHLLGFDHDTPASKARMWAFKGELRRAALNEGRMATRRKKEPSACLRKEPRARARPQQRRE